jgi:hypothetical protein
LFEFLPDSLRRLFCVDHPMRFRQPSEGVACNGLVEIVVIGVVCFSVAFVCDVQNGHGTPKILPHHSSAVVRKVPHQVRSPTSTQHSGTWSIPTHCAINRALAAQRQPAFFGNLPKALRWRAQETLRHGENIKTVLLGYFLIAAIAGAPLQRRSHSSLLAY